MCNDKRIGSPDPSKLQCYKCSSEDEASSCRTGSIDNNSVTCGRSDQICLQYYVSTSRRDTWVRECAKPGQCNDLGNKYGQSLEQCDECEDDYCNNVRMSIASNIFSRQ
ncbi:hypothetical protein WA026_000575 [Henosepilachna vigintioctopunctata]|uniref:Protein sleepless n=1 Tax=Henosepilachna vigintioctopunctata TaxID=420089 RepID=A0AAW1V497_9CUCU